MPVYDTCTWILVCHRSGVHEPGIECACAHAGVRGMVVPWHGAQHGGLLAQPGLGPPHLHPLLAALALLPPGHSGMPPYSTTPLDLLDDLLTTNLHFLAAG